MAKAAAQYGEMSVEELLDKVDQLRTELFNMRVGNTTKELQNTAKIRLTKRELARTLTALTAKQRA
jgi:large subunit ribosomal protein L29